MEFYSVPYHCQVMGRVPNSVLPARAVTWVWEARNPAVLERGMYRRFVLV